ncbi:RNA polymerase sigma-70 factor [Prolixibacteraceae bacterium JC049]|nr:RNA polymerase sigma-70 factor [Prolixibacteraceae bacterium JC049]
MQIIGGIEEQVLVNRLKGGDQTAFELLFRFYYPGLVIFASQIILDKAEAEEIVQDFFVRLWEQRNALKEGTSLKSYVFTSVKNRSLNFLKRSNVNDKLVGEVKDLVENSEVYEPDIFVESELQDQIKLAISKLPSRCGEIFVLSRINGLSNDEIAEKLNISKRTVETQISNALKVLRVEFKDYSGMLIFLGIINF